ncbi:nucleotidyltransferase family protein [Paraburkholderia hospita]|uniref:nucleotidyltransferase family protein n=1 Tax=Paraburkholderia hospita TaxID=169430 RepID=UPI001F61872C|nr:nucleotidyltransferase domain-containing protein [Paraburkholderia hospita]
MRTLRFWAEAQPHVRRLWVFGSRLKGTQRDDSDLDVAMEIDAFGQDESAAVSWVGYRQQCEHELCALTGFAVQLHPFDCADSTSKVVAYVSCCAALVYARKNRVN